MDMAGGDDLLAGTRSMIDGVGEPGSRQATAGIVWSSDGDVPLFLDGPPPSESGWRVEWHRTVFGPNTSARKHTTPTFDVDLVISGEVDLLLENGDVHLEPGDTVVIPGVVHGWRTGSSPCDFICVMWSHAAVCRD